MKFVHMADCHLGGWREPKMRAVNETAFETAIDKTIEEKADFLLIAGDLFNTAFPGIDSLKLAVNKLKQLKEAGIPTYIIAGSHDFSPSGKTMLDVLETAGLVHNVARAEIADGKLRLKYTHDKTGAKITGIIGKRAGLESTYYENLERENTEEGYKIFMFHTAVAELKPKELADMESMPASLLPKGFDYYAGGHVHITDNATIGEYKNIVYPGPTYPNSFSELEKLHKGTIVIVDDKIRHIAIEPKKTKHITIDADNKTPAETEEKAMAELADADDKIITIRISGQLKNGKPSDINWQAIAKTAYERGAYFLMKNSNKLTSKNIEKITISETSIEAVEDKLLKEHGQQRAKESMHVLSVEKKEGEKTSDYERRIVREMDSLLSLSP